MVMDNLLYTKVTPFLMYYGNAFLLFTRKLHCLQILFEHMSANWIIKVGPERLAFDCERK